MSSILETLLGQLKGDNVQQISRQIGADERQTETAVQAALPTLLAALSRNASRPDGAEALHRALAKDHDGSMLDDLPAYLRKPEAGPGDGILRHVLGSRRPTVEQGLSKASGMDSNATNKLMAALAPMVMGALGKEQRRGGLDASALAGLLGQQRQEAERRAPKEMGLLEKLLDADKDGDTDMGDFIKHGTGLLGKMFGGR
jgi:hypothetical protein